MRKSVKILLIVTSAFAIFVASCAVAFATLTRGAILDDKKLLLPDNKIEVLDGENTPVSNVSAFFARETFRMEELPEKAKNAFVDAEDKRFYSHDGFDFARMAKATLKNIGARSFKEGASTISQQLIKNTHLSQEKTVKRKLKEIKLTYRLERKYSKDEILEKYLNTIYFGHSCFGLKSAARFYFGKEPSELTLSDAAVLAGLIRSPNNYSPFKHPENCSNRRKTVINAMLAQGHIDEKEKAEALSVPLPETPFTVSVDRSFFDRVFDELEEKQERYSFSLGGSLRIYTDFDGELQAALENLAGEAEETDKIFSVLDNRTHGFKAFYSSAGSIKRLPGSLIKPLLVYAPSIEENIVSPATPLLDEKIDFGGYEPKNYNGEYGGYLSVRECLAKSVNVPAVKLLNTLGVKKGAEYLRRLDLEIPEEDYSLALALGGMRNGFTLNRLVSAYSVFPCGGEYAPAGFIREIVADGRSVYRRADVKTRVFSEETSYLVTDMLKTAAQSGTAKKLRTLHFPIAAKTGTSGTEKGNTDAYALSYTAADCVGVWLGNADNSTTEITGGALPCNLALKINEYLYRDSPPQDFFRPQKIVRADLDKTEYYVSHNIILADENSPAAYRMSELFKSSALPRKKSDKFSNPSISPPSLSYEDGKVTISLKKAPDFYDYQIDRYDYVTHNTVYSGKFTTTFIDNVENGKTYVYTVTPLFNGRKGKGIELPAVTTKTKNDGIIPIEPETPPPITQKEWWNY